MSDTLNSLQIFVFIDGDIRIRKLFPVSDPAEIYSEGSDTPRRFVKRA
jgi:hypothetical protein